MAFDNEIGTIRVGDDGVAVLTLQMDGKANLIDETFIVGLAAMVEWLEAHPPRGVIVASGHKDFCVGADLDFVYGEREPSVILRGVTTLNATYRKLETLGVPVVAALTGSALGGGMELALACHRRIAVDSPKVQLGFPEVNLGVIPGAGGTQRLPRLVGLQAALEHIVQARVVRAPKAVGTFVDALAPDAQAVLAAAREWIAANPAAKQPWDDARSRFPPPRPGSADARNLLMAASAMLYDKTAGAYPAAEAAVSVIAEGTALTFDAGVQIEARAFARLATSDQAKDMIRTLWYHRSAAEKHEGLPALPAGEDAGIGMVAVLGAGMMGAGLGFVCAKAGYDVVVRDVSQAALDKARAHLDRQAARRLEPLDADARAEILGRIKLTLELEDVCGADLVIEAVFEDKALKHRVIAEVEPLMAADAIFASNTSALPISELAAASADPEGFVGLHFFSPVEQMPLLEIVEGQQTSEHTVARCLAFCRKIGKTPIVVNDGYGFYTTRVFAAYILEGAELVAEGHDPVLVEWAARTAGMAVPPLQVFDEITLRLGRHIVDEVEARQGGIAARAGVALIKKMVDESGRTGRADGAGFYDYDGGKRRGIWPGLRDVTGVRIDGDPQQQVALLRRRLMLAQAAEVARALDEGVLQRYRDAEVGAVFGLGFAPNTGGPLAWMDRQGIRELVAELDTLADQVGERYRPAPVLRQMAEAGERFFER